MITAQTTPSFDELVSQLSEAVQAAAEAHVQNARLSANSDPIRWRRPSLLWPTFAPHLSKKG